MKLDASEIARFRKFYAVGEGCWIWKGSKTPDGHGTFMLRKKTTRAHRVAYAIAHPRTKPGSKMVVHTCFNSMCVNPAHLIQATAAQAGKLRVKAGRHPKGSEARNARLDASAVARIRRSSKTLKQIAIEEGVSQSCVFAAKSGRTYKGNA